MKPSFLCVILLIFSSSLWAQEIQFDKTAALQFLQGGTAQISGVVFARDNTAMIKGIAVLNMNPKQMAQKGTEVILIPYTAYFKTWAEENKRRSKKGIEPVSLPQEAYECILKTQVRDDLGRYTFRGLNPGKFLLITNFDYDHTYSVTRTEGYINSYLGNMYIGSSPIERIYHYDRQEFAYVEKIVEIKRKGEELEVDLKRTK